MFKGKRASDNPWEATTLEWTTATPPPHDNFGGHTPVVHNGPYEYNVPRAPRDYVMQSDPEIGPAQDRKSTRLNSSHSQISYAVFCLKKKKPNTDTRSRSRTA